MKINSASLDALRVGFKTNFQGGLGQAAPMYSRVATKVTSSTRSEKYGWLGKMPNIREWIGDRQVQNISEYDYEIKNKPFELTIGVDRDDIEDDTLGSYGPLFQEMGMSTAAFPEQLVWPLLKAGFTTNCYDGQYFFDVDHPVLDADGTTVNSVANTDGGAGTPWFLICSKRALKPIIFQERKPFEFVAMDDSKDENVFRRKEFQYGVDGRANVGYGFWQFAWGSKQTLDAAHYETARTAISSFKGDFGRPLGLVPDLLVVPPSLEGAGKAILSSQLINGGESNKWAGTAELLVVPWLA
ncbi:Mu-like prophage major head subunit gpT family protein [Mesorhizobium sp. ES1-1]|uniref:Mu-like prophage major head subunit gpT family protein n=1 Tax=Mesorhizobium sp. ES1-1 TaxID=2876629 RepID=UPI001CCE476E|nr:Mu-like prophage major head subunit gpT family protein [Mesorhizobium sp. ES1-1]MBZ9678901.1 Mu-like prophage major head subunit gpT family protein [Mesorhizobium sp. ES1-1]